MSDRRAIQAAVLETILHAYVNQYCPTLPHLTSAEWDAVDYLPVTRQLAETLGDAILAFLIQIMVSREVPHLPLHVREAIWKVLTQNTTFSHVLLKYAGICSNVHKAPGNALERMVGFCSQSWSLGRLYRWVCRTFGPLIPLTASRESTKHSRSAPDAGSEERIAKKSQLLGRFKHHLNYSYLSAHILQPICLFLEVYLYKGRLLSFAGKPSVTLLQPTYPDYRLGRLLANHIFVLQNYYLSTHTSPTLSQPTRKVLYVWTRHGPDLARARAFQPPIPFQSSDKSKANASLLGGMTSCPRR
ncbi:hypothetical protein B0H17DRAFT_1131718 [Mycena rosella]|uniref:RNase III domain-containing protein n=1 Tax=Mycena rosella TaxID=1033263 RepID=A0AAD7DP16_MYCRO|nr:hypothetical protein B0H17DRAFT_1131718 [Mycena rosella]